MPSVELAAFCAREQVALGKGNGGRVMRFPRGDRENALWFPMRTSFRHIVDRTEPEECSQRLQQGAVAVGHRNLEDEVLAGRTVGKRSLLRGDDEGAFCCDEPAEREADRIPCFEERWKKLGGAEGDRIPGLRHAMAALYQLSYSPENGQVTSGHSGLECVADRTHVCIMTLGYDNFP
jgi:hypothetical protein